MIQHQRKYHKEFVKTFKDCPSTTTSAGKGRVLSATEESSDGPPLAALLDRLGVAAMREMKRCNQRSPRREGR